MMQRNLTITLEPDWKAAMRATAKLAKAKTYQGEVLNFETPAQFFGQLTERRWELVRTAQGRGEISVRELARLVDRDVKRVHEDVTVLAALGLHLHRCTSTCIWRRRKDAFVILAQPRVAHPPFGWALHPSPLDRFAPPPR
jgi:phage FluMu protein gp41